MPDSDESIRRDKLQANAHNSAVRLLARREHAAAEIRQKLKFRGYDDNVTAEVIDDLLRQRLLSDERFAEMFIRSRAERGQGPARLRVELR
ncbi:MAG: regulatory protein RecX, partial [Steroidobacter sp.]